MTAHHDEHGEGAASARPSSHRRFSRPIPPTTIPPTTAHAAPLHHPCRGHPHPRTHDNHVVGAQHVPRRSRRPPSCTTHRDRPIRQLRADDAPILICGTRRDRPIRRFAGRCCARPHLRHTPGTPNTLPHTRRSPNPQLRADAAPILICGTYEAHAAPHTEILYLTAPIHHDWGTTPTSHDHGSWTFAVPI